MEPSSTENEAGAETGESDDPRVGKTVGGRWRVVRAIGRGGMGVVYEAQNVAIGKRVALKFIDPEFASDREVVSRFQREAEAASAVESAHIVELFDTGVEDGVPYLVMELLRGESLGARLRRSGRLSIHDAVHVVAQALRGLARAHRAGVIHRDLKPDNVFLVDRDDDPQFAKILDFGISKITRRPGEVGAGTLTRKGTVLGTPFYMSPEQAQAHADVDERTDIFAMGAILFECLTGKAPHSELGTYEAVIVAICTKDLPDVRGVDPAIPEALANVVKKATARDRNARFSSATEMLDALRAAMPGVVSSRRATPIDGPTASISAPSSSTPATPPPTKTSWTARNEFGRAPTMQAVTARKTKRPLLAIGIVAAATAFVATIAIFRFGAGALEKVGPVSASSDRPAPELAMRVETVPPNATIVVDGRPAADATIRGAALTKHALHVEAEGFSPVDRDVVLDGRASLRIELSPSVTKADATNARPPSSPPGHVPPPTSGKKTPLATPPTPPPAPSPPSNPPGLKLKVDP